MTDLDVQVYKELVVAGLDKLEKAVCKLKEPDSPPSEKSMQLSAKKDGILTAIHLFDQVQQQKNRKVSSIKKKLVLSGKFTEKGDRISDIQDKRNADMQVPDWLGEFDPESIISENTENKEAFPYE